MEDIVFANLLLGYKSNRGPPNGLAEEIMGCIWKFNSMNGYRLSIRNFTTAFNDMCGTNIAVANMYEY
jgi:hypothetical protein